MKRGESGRAFIIGVNKPCGMTSHDVVGRMRRALGERRVGHAGTLDPAASGVLVVGVGQATRLLGLLTLDDKRYVARIRFGAQTDTDDAEGEIVATAPVPQKLADRAYAEGVLASFLGSQLQVPPAYSAISVDGRRAYARARSGEEVVLEPRAIEVYETNLFVIEEDEGGIAWTCAFTVSKGTYIRALARDIGACVGVPAHLEALERTGAGPVGLTSCLSLEKIAQLDPDSIEGRGLDPVKLLKLPVRALGEEEYARSVTGAPLSAAGLSEGERVCLVHGGRLVGIWQVKQGKLRCESNFPGGIGGVGHDIP